jgi:hypothetical protein
VPSHQFLEEFQCCSFVSALRDDGFKHFTFVFYSAPEVVPLSIHLHEDLVHMPLPFRERAKLLDPLSSGLRGKHWTEPVPPVADGFVADIYSAFMQQIFHFPKRKRETDVLHHSQADDLGTGLKVLERDRFGHSRTLRKSPAPLKQSYSDKAERTVSLPRG